MGLADRFREKLNNKDIFENTTNIKHTTQKPDDKINIKTNITPITSPIDKTTEKNNNFEELKQLTINKISKTPYWEDYSEKNKIIMLGKYFDAKTKGENHNTNIKNEFIKSILQQNINS